MLIVGRMPQAGIDVLKKRDDVDYEILTDDTVPSLPSEAEGRQRRDPGRHAVPPGRARAAPVMLVVARLGVGFDAVEVPALNKRRIPLMTTGTANSVSVAEHAMYMLLASARLVKKYDRFVRENAWGERSEGSSISRASRSSSSAWAASARAR